MFAEVTTETRLLFYLTDSIEASLCFMVFRMTFVIQILRWSESTIA